MAALNQLINDQNLPPPAESPRFGSAPTLGASMLKAEDAPESTRREDREKPVGAGFLNWGPPFCDLLDHPAILPILRLRLGDCFRLDRLYGMYMLKGMRYGKLHSDYGASAPNSGARPGEYYAFRSNQIYEGFIVVSWALSDSGPEHGGFYCIPAATKATTVCPSKSPTPTKARLMSSCRKRPPARSCSSPKP